MKYPIGLQMFNKIIEDGYLYVDKTDLVYKHVSEGIIYFLSHPRRFSESFLILTLKNYFGGFRGVNIDALGKEWVKKLVFVISFSGNNYTEERALEAEVEQKYGQNADAKNLFVGYLYVLKVANEKIGHRVVAFVDEYNKPLLGVMEIYKYVTDTDDEKVKLETPLYIYILEFNLNGSVKAAFQQIKDRNYVASYAADSWKGICIYVNFSSATDAVMGKKRDYILLN